MTIGNPGGDQQIIVSNSKGFAGMKVEGKKLFTTPVDRSMHDLTGHAVPHVSGPITGNAVTNEILVRQELGMPRGQPDPRGAE